METWEEDRLHIDTGETHITPFRAGETRNHTHRGERKIRSSFTQEREKNEVRLNLLQDKEPDPKPLEMVQTARGSRVVPKWAMVPLLHPGRENSCCYLTIDIYF